MKDYILKCKDLNPRLSKVSLELQVVSKQEVRSVKSHRDRTPHKMTEVLVGDETGVILMTLWDENVGQLDAGKTYLVENGYVTLFKGSMRLNLGKYGEVKEVNKQLTVDAKNNLSERIFQEPRRMSVADRFSSGSFWPDH